ncbi:glycosyltransferase family 8 protein [Vibrio mediterranei]|uniref:Glycosyltransferase family 8 protein n=1 Tax=Vibrio mediterranei TaxID=689 RepID=A0AAN1FET9_9VIBR|nr:glycosyltransferase family 8 protein [Vibrio mediterranei]ASI89243.1 hypothetical protein BSZ05_05155 [Vibrio mediterranei]
MQAKIINLAFCCDRKYLVHFHTAVLSVLNNKDAEDDIRVNLFFDGIQDDDRLNEVIEHLNSLGVFLNVIFPDVSYLSTAKVDKNIPVSAYFRLLIPEFLSDLDRVLYLDCDLIVTASLSKLFYHDLKGNTIGAVEDVGVSNRVLDKLGVENYFNSGVLLIDVKQFSLRSAECIDFLTEHDLITFHDQCVLNYIFKKSWLSLEKEWNYMSNNFAESSGFLGFKILHYNAIYGKPWEVGCFHPLRCHYLYTRANSIFSNEKLQKPRLLVILRNKFKILDKVLKAIRGFN